MNNILQSKNKNIYPIGKYGPALVAVNHAATVIESEIFEPS